LNKPGTSKNVLVMYPKEFQREVLAACDAGGGTGSKVVAADTQ